MVRRMASDGFGWPLMASDGLGWLRMASGQVTLPATRLLPDRLLLSPPVQTRHTAHYCSRLANTLAKRLNRLARRQERHRQRARHGAQERHRRRARHGARPFGFGDCKGREGERRRERRAARGVALPHAILRAARHRPDRRPGRRPGYRSGRRSGRRSRACSHLLPRRRARPPQLAVSRWATTDDPDYH